MLRWGQIHAGQLCRLPSEDNGPCRRDPSGLEGAGAVIRANVRCLLERMLLVGEGVGQAARTEEAVGKAGGGEGKMGETLPGGEISPLLRQSLIFKKL